MKLFIYLMMGSVSLLGINAHADLAKGETQVHCMKDSTTEKSLAKLNESLLARPKISIPILDNAKGFVRSAAMPITVSSPVIYKDGANVYSCVTITQN